jgi:nicotinamidase-related amidase
MSSTPSIFPEADDLLPLARPMADKIAGLKRRAKAAGVPVIYVNDNFGRWQSNLQRIVENAARPDSKGREIVARLLPEQDDYFVLKPKHSGFFSTSLDVLLEYLQAETVILCGIAANICVLFTANDAFMRDLHVVVPANCVASNSEEINHAALREMALVLKADTRPSAELTFPYRRSDADAPKHPAPPSTEFAPAQ